jgi:hypothetical protein
MGDHDLGSLLTSHCWLGVCLVLFRMGANQLRSLIELARANNILAELSCRIVTQ